ncbi:conserved Plasmodium protein, unknown function [Plasmodium sp. gorilla clade G2]|uniref:conserved Plasmodium protein, unknown function n=1 Tax=Plasmodium sp. gorilla clade G2 TaxID=880535 RepID=UPI000D22A663|nr:conserved Plasmodium protein, unknown function [Plasmodium sp. gorilla clade G2]SOV19489.1 conserved Plasmodium protein, unknown function [Plasmodium sp. gorilla clade G2]
MDETTYDDFNAHLHSNINDYMNYESDSKEKENEANNDSENSQKEEDINDNDNVNNINNNIENNINNNNDNNNNNISKNKKNKKKNDDDDNYKKLKNDDDIKLAVKIAIQVLLNNQPFPIKRDDLFYTISIYVPSCNTSIKRKVILRLLKKQLNNVLALNLLTLSSKTKTEYSLSQNIFYKEHNDLLLSNIDHTIRGFLIFLIPFFNVFHNKLPLNYLLYQLNMAGHNTLKTKEDIIKIITTPTLHSNIVYTNISNNDINDPIDLIIYAKKLSYIEFNNEQYDENSIDGFYIIPTLRFQYEINMKAYINQLMNMPHKKFQLKDMYVLFDEKYFVDINFDNL